MRMFDAGRGGAMRNRGKMPADNLILIFERKQVD
jgi:hypothetical protein